MSSTHLECQSCGKIMFEGNMEDPNVCDYCGSNSLRYAYTTSGAWEDPFVEQREWEKNNR